jgi:outer membrane lipopolysaccharide assembly protein LptE/RlpB
MKPRQRKSVARSIALLALLVALGGCAGYRFGAQSLFPADIQTVHVPVFKSISFRRDLGEELTEAVVKEIEKRTPYKVVADANADSVLLGSITQEHKHMLVETINGDQREMDLNLVVKVRWVNRRGDVIRQCPPVKVPTDLVDVNASAHFVPEYGQSTATAQLQAIQRLAEEIVNLMEAPW